MQRREFVLKFQQITGPVMAKGMEDTAFYRFYPLASLNEVGGSPVGAPLWVEQFHDRMKERAEKWPQSMSATATHDTKRGEDFRARLNVLSEVAGEWESAINRWREQNAPARSDVEGTMVPDANEEYLIYQTLVGTWPLNPSSSKIVSEEYRDRIVSYFEKALREAKWHTSWLSPQASYEEAVQNFIRRILEPTNNAFLESLDAFVRSISDAGFVNSLTQLVLKGAVPGIPDFYQGTEFWDFNLVDPDNRRGVDFQRRSDFLRELDQVANENPSRISAELMSTWPDDRIKLFVTTTLLRLRKSHAPQFAGDYNPLAAIGERANHLCAFRRGDDKNSLVFVVPRFVCQAIRTFASYPEPSADMEWAPSRWWQGTQVTLPEGSPRKWRNLFTGHLIEADRDSSDYCNVAADDVLKGFPVAILEPLH
jgi:(1->4)-alpha-D-glucan 1-alpha-D-glucosylmutase